MKILGIDPALTKSGWAVIERLNNKNIYIASGIITTKSQTDMAERLKYIFDNFSGIISQYKPEIAAIEETFVNQNANSSLKLGLARGAIITCLALNNLKVSEFSPRFIKKTLTGSGAADKHQMLKMIHILMPQADIKFDDEADAIAIALAA